MEFAIILTIVAAVTVIAIIYFVTQKRRGRGEASQNVIQQMQSIREEMVRNSSEHRKEVQQQLERVHDQLTKGMRHSHSSMQKQFNQSAKIIQEVTEKLTALDKTNKRVLDFSSQLQNLQNILKNPKQRGVLGEYWLETLLSNVLPKDSYEMQKTLGKAEKSGKTLIADAVIYIREQMIPIDAKFSLENYNRMVKETDSDKKQKLERKLKSDVKLRIDETSKYIRPDFHTMGFAFMFIPAEGVYYNLLNAEVGSGINSRNLIEYAFNQHVMIVSPTSFYAYLQTVLMGLRELQLEESTQEIIKRVGELGKHMRSYADYHNRMGNNLQTVVNQYEQSGKELRKMSKDVARIEHGTASEEHLIEIDEVDGPKD